MGKKIDKPVFSSVTEELMYLRKQNAGLKGQIGLLNSQKKDLNKCVDSLKDEILRNEKIVKGLESQVNEMSESLSNSQKEVRDLRDEVAPMKANIEYYNNLPWIVKMFTFRIH